MSIHEPAGNPIYDEGACSLSEALKVNITLTTLKLKCSNLFLT